MNLAVADAAYVQRILADPLMRNSAILIFANKQDLVRYPLSLLLSRFVCACVCVYVCVCHTPVTFSHHHA